MAKFEVDFTSAAQPSRPPSHCRKAFTKPSHDAWVAATGIFMTGNSFLHEYCAIKAQIGIELSRYRHWQEMPRLLDALDSLRTQRAQSADRSLRIPNTGLTDIAVPRSAEPAAVIKASK